MSNLKSKPKIKTLYSGIIILYEDRDLIVVDKPPGILTMGTETEKSKTVYAILFDYVRDKQKGARIFIVHRLDRETSGILIFAKNEKAKHILQEDWDNVEKKYLAIVHGKLDKKESILESYLVEAGTNRVYKTPDKTEGKLSRTAYKVIKETKKFSLLEVNLLTGRKHQIRVQLADVGNPIVGDPKYGIQDGYVKRMALHSWSVTFNHPIIKKKMFFQTIVPGYFIQLVGEWRKEEPMDGPKENCE